jgi:hypothetical protein
MLAIDADEYETGALAFGNAKAMIRLIEDITWLKDFIGL